MTEPSVVEMLNKGADVRPTTTRILTTDSERWEACAVWFNGTVSTYHPAATFAFPKAVRNEHRLITDSTWELRIGWRDNVGGWFYPSCCLPHPNNDAACDRNEALSPPLTVKGNDANVASSNSSASVPHDGSAFNDNISHCRYLKIMVQRSLEVHGFPTTTQKRPCPFCPFGSDGCRLRRHLLSLHDLGKISGSRGTPAGRASKDHVTGWAE